MEERAFTSDPGAPFCTDAMSGEAFEQTVTIDLDGKTYRGCGWALR